MITINQLTILFGGVELFEDISFVINPRDRIGLVGKNGAGKTTLLKIINGEQEYDAGEIVIPSGISLGYLPQLMQHQDGKTVYEEAISAFSEVLNLEKEILRINHELSQRTDYESKDYLKLINKLTEANEHFDLIGGAAIHADVEQTLTGLGFLTTDFDRPTSEFSGGWRMRIELVKILLKRPSVLLLDEPTNHLDIESIQWLEDFLKGYYGAVVLISHDRAFLDNVTERTIEIYLRKIYDYKASYSRYVELRKERREQQMATYKNQQKKIEETEDFIERFRYKATKAVQVQSRIKQLDKLERVEVDEEDLSSINIKFPLAPRSGTIVVEAKTLKKAYDQHVVLNNLDFVIERGEKVAFVGKNGEGKSTFSKIIMGEIAHEGELKLGHNVKIGYFAQNQDELMDGNKTVFQTIDDIAVGDIRTKVRDILGAFLFGQDAIDKKVKVLSGGECSRLAMAKLLLEPVNLLLLDEPTNHLDLRSKDVLKQALKKYDGTLIIVSHDRDFLDGLVEKVYEFKDKKTYQHIGGIYDFIRKKKIESLKALERRNLATANQRDKSDNSKQAYEEKKEQEKIIRKAANQVAQSEVKIQAIEAEMDQINNKLLAGAENENLSQLAIHYHDLQTKLELEMNNWQELNEELENLQAASKLS